MKAVAAIVLLGVGFGLGMLCAPVHRSQRVSPSVAVVRDTVRIVTPAAVRREYIGSRELRLPADSVEVRQDSVRLELPMESRLYRSEDYTAWVSGWQPRLDSIVLTPKITQIELGGAEQRTKKESRWSIGIQAGVGMTPAGVQPYIGVGVGWRFTL